MSLNHGHGGAPRSVPRLVLHSNIALGRSPDQEGLVGFLFHDEYHVCLRPICPRKGPRDGFTGSELCFIPNPIST